MSRENNQSQSSIKRALKAVEKMQTKLEDIEYLQREPIAIVGIGCRFPGGANNPEQFWHFLHNGVDAITEVPKDRWDIDKYYNSDRETLGKIYTRNGGFLQDVDLFDPYFFGISPKEAHSLDPQHRLLLEVTWEALEHGGQTPESLKDSSTGVFIGIGRNDYGQTRFTDSSKNEEISIYDGTGNSLCFASGRISYVMGLQGPNMAIETACSSSLVAVHLACQSLRNQECKLAITGGVNLNFSPEVAIFLSSSQVLSPDGRSKTFDARADGFGHSEGCGIVVLKRLSDAIANGDKIWATIRGSAVNHDGPSSGITVPNQIAQEKLIRQALTSAKVDPTEVDYVEAHGTGTSLGDPIEIGALASVLCRQRSHSNPLAIGSVKTNLGHLEAAAGIVGLIKVVLSLNHEEIPPHLHFSTPNPHIPWNEISVVVPTSPIPWSRGNKSRIAGVSSFGFSGTNAHVVLEEAPIPVKNSQSKIDSKDIQQRRLQILTLSAKNQAALNELVNSYENYLEVHPELELGNICYTANTGRTHFDRRLAVISSNQKELVEKLRNYKRAEDTAGVYLGKSDKNNKAGKIAFLFTGQGSQYVNMGLELYQTHPVFRESIEKCSHILDSELEHSLLSIIYPDTTNDSNSSLLDQTAYTQPALFAIEYALAKLWESWGIKPDILIGHSVGEYVAATVAGIFSLEDGIKLIAHRGRLMQKLPSSGGMVAVMASEARVKEVITQQSSVVAIAAINGPESVVISGESEAIAGICSQLEATGIKTKHLQVSHAFHSPMMEPVLAEFEALAKNISYNQPKIPIISNVTGKRADNSIATERYWVDHVRQPVKFAQGMEILYQLGYETYLEIGAKPTLLGMGRQSLPEDFGVWLPSLRPGINEGQSMLSSLGQLYVRGAKVDWLELYRDLNKEKVVLPTYPFQKQRYWVEPREKTEPKSQTLASENHNTAIFNLLSQGETEVLAQELEKSVQLSPSQQKLLPEILEILAKQHQQQLATDTIRNWLYQVQWKPITLTEGKSSIQNSHWLILADSTGVGEKLAASLQQQGNECSLVYRGEKYAQVAAGKYEVNPCVLEEWEQLYQEISGVTQLPLSQVIHLWSLDIGAKAELTLEELEENQLWGCGSVIYWLQTVLKTRVSPQLWVVTRGAQSVFSEKEKLAVAATALWGLGRVVCLEHPQLWGGMVDLDPQKPQQEVEMLGQLLVNNLQEDHLALRGEETYVARLVKESVPEFTKAISLSSDDSYLITGGLGALGLHTAQWLVRKGVRHLVLIGRNAPSETAQETIEQLEQAGSKVSVLLGDISLEKDVAKIIQQIQTFLPTLKGVIHTAGVLEDATLQQMSLEHFSKVMAPKVAGTWHLHKFTQNMPLDFFVCFSSIASLFGSPGQGNYAAANAFMDAFAHYRRSMGLPGLSINWGVWTSGGMVDRLAIQHQNRIHTSGIGNIAPEQGMSALEQLLANQSQTEQVAVIPVNWSVLTQQLSNINKNSLLRELLQKDELEQNTLKRNADQQILDKLETVPAKERQEILREHLRMQVAQVLGSSSSDLPEINLGFMEMGMDSLMTVELKNRLQTQLGKKLSGTVAIEYPTIEKLSRYIFEEVMGWKSILDSESNLPNLEDINNKMPELEQISEAEFEALAAQELEELKSML